jgi:hypothetical protein
MAVDHSKGWQVKVIECNPWRSATFTGSRLRFKLVPPPGVILADCDLDKAADALTALVIDD